MATLELGSVLGDLKVRIRKDRAWNASLVLKEVGGTPEAPTKTPIAWPSAPVLEFEGGFTVTGVRSADAETSTPNAKATWTMTKEQATALTHGLDASLTVDGEEWFAGMVFWV